MRKIRLSVSKVLFLGLIESHSSAFAFFITPVDVAVECPAPHNDPFILKCAGYYDFVIDDGAVFWRGEKILSADPKSFEMINRYYAKDKNHVYQNFAGNYRSYYAGSVPDLAQKQAHSWIISATHDEFWEVVYLADPKTFKVHPEYNEYSYDQNYLYHKGLLVEKMDSTTLDRLQKAYVKTNHVDGQKGNRAEIKETSLSVDIASFQILNARDNIFKDKNHVYNEEMIFEDKNNFYNEIMIVKGADAGTFQLFSSKSKYGKDKAKVFWLDWHSKEVVGADLTTFAVDSINPRWAKDQNSVFYKGNKIKELDPNMFKALAGNYVKDHTGIYFSTFGIIRRIEGIDIDSFSMVDNIEPNKINMWNTGSRLSKDQFHVYYEEKIIDRADPKTFETLGRNFAKDKNHAYYRKSGNYPVIDGVDLATFTADKYSGMQDKDHKYSVGGKITSKKSGNNCHCSSQKISENSINSNEFMRLAYMGFYPDKYSSEEDDWESCGIDSPCEYRAESDQIITNYWKSLDKVIYQEEHLPNVDAKSFKVLELNFGRDNQNIYYQDQIIEGVDAESFVVLDSDYSRDKNQLFYQQNKVIDLTKENYTEKPYRHYHGGALLKRVYSDELEVYHHKPYAKVGSQVFYKNEVINGISTSTFYSVNAPYKYYDERTKLSDIYSRDEHYVYYKTQRVEGADPNSFMVTEVPSSNPRYRMPIKAKDKFACYEEARRVACK